MQKTPVGHATKELGVLTSFPAFDVPRSLEYEILNRHRPANGIVVELHPCGDTGEGNGKGFSYWGRGIYRFAFM